MYWLRQQLYIARQQAGLLRRVNLMYKNRNNEPKNTGTLCRESGKMSDGPMQSASHRDSRLAIGTVFAIQREYCVAHQSEQVVPFLCLWFARRVIGFNVNKTSHCTRGTRHGKNHP